MLSRLDRYLLKELSVPFFLGLMILTFILIMQQVLILMELVLDKGIDLASIATLFVHLLPAFFLITIPMAVMLSTVTTFNRLSADNEIIALHAGGIGFFRLIRPVILFASLVGLLTLFMGFNTDTVKGASKKVAVKLLMKRASLGLEAGIFNNLFPGMMIYVESMPTFSELSGVFIYDQRNPDRPTVIVAKRGVLINDEAANAVRLNLVDGSLQQGEKGSQRYQRMVFGDYELKINLPQLMQSQSEKKGLNLTEIKQQIAESKEVNVRDLRLLSDYYKRFVFAFTAMLFCLMGMPLGILSGRLSRLGGFAAGIVIILIYYMLMTLGDYLISVQVLSPLTAAMFPILVLIPFCIFLLKRVASNVSPTIFGIASKRP